MERVQMPQALKRRLGTGTLTPSSCDVDAYERMVCDSENKKLGNLTGYDGGIEKKQWLLAHEGLELSRFHVPAGKRAQ